MRERPELEALREAIDAYARAHARDIVAEANEAAQARVRSTLTDALADSMLEHARAELAGSRPTSDRVRSPASRTGEAGYYVYGVVTAGTTLPAELAGVDGSARVELIECGELAAIASRVSLAEFGEEELHERLEDVEWLEELARAHESVLDEALSRTTVVPMRLCTIYRSESHVREMLADEEGVVADALTRLAARAEWGVKLVAEPGALERAASRSDAADEENASLSPGAAYMRGKGRQVRARDELDRLAEAWAEEVHGRLAQRSAEALVNPVQNPEVSGHVGDMLLNGVYLVPDADIGAFRAEVAALADEFAASGASVELTGPWPPYNFVKGSIEAAR